MNGNMNRRNMTGNAVIPLKNGTRTFQYGDVVEITDGHLLHVNHPNTNHSVSLNISDLSYNTNDETSINNWNSDTVLFTAQPGDEIIGVCTPKSLTISGSSTKINFFLIRQDLNRDTLIMPTTETSAMVIGEPIITSITVTETTTYICVATWHSYKSGVSYEIEWDIHLYLNGKRVV